MKTYFTGESCAAITRRRVRDFPPGKSRGSTSDFGLNPESAVRLLF
jgi:hypothetical protein